MKDMEFNLMAQKEATERLERLPAMLKRVEDLLDDHNNTVALEGMHTAKARVLVEYIQLLMTIKAGAEIDLEHLAESSELNEVPEC